MAGVVKNGFFPLPPDVADGILKHLRVAIGPQYPGKAITILDPCAGEGLALSKLSGGLVAHDVVPYAVELNSERAARIAERFPGINLLGPASFFGTRITYVSFSLIYLNPPFDSEMGGGGREELAFLKRATDLMVRGGILVFVLPANQVIGQVDMCNHLDCHYEDIEIFKLPDGQRKFGECIVIAKRRFRDVYETANAEEKHELRKRGVTYGGYYDFPGDPTFSRHLPEIGGESPLAYEDHRGGWPKWTSGRALKTWEVPYAYPPRTFDKFQPTDEELMRELERSPAYDKLAVRAEARIARPPLPLNKGHVSLCIMSGMLDGYVASDPPHVVRGACGKVERHVRSEAYDTPGGSHVEKEVFAQVPDPRVRAVWGDGTIKTFATKPKGKDGTNESEAIVDLDEELPEDD